MTQRTITDDYGNAVEVNVDEAGWVNEADAWAICVLWRDRPKGDEVYARGVFDHHSGDLLIVLGAFDTEDEALEAFPEALE